MTRRLFPVALAVALTFAGGARAHDFTLGALTIAHPYSVETAPTAKTGAGYLTVTNAGPDADRLVAVEADFPKSMLHITETDASGVSRMTHVEGFDIPAGGAATLEPRAGHVMFMGLAEPLKAGDEIPATLVFEKAGRIDVVFKVEARDAGAEDEGGGQEGHGGDAGHGSMTPPG